MKQVFLDYQERVKEVEEYFNFLKLLDDPLVTIKKKDESGTESQVQTAPSWLPFFKATSFIIIYNLVEATVRAGFSRLYLDIHSSGIPLSGIQKSFIKLWIEQVLKDCEPLTSNFNTYKDKINEISEKLLSQGVCSLDVGKLPISGNLDSRKIFELCKLHLISQKISKNANSGRELKLVKDNRNDLAHGNRSFLECGRDYTVDGLVRIKSESFAFLECILKNIEDFMEKKGYVKNTGTELGHMDKAEAVA